MGLMDLLNREKAKKLAENLKPSEKGPPPPGSIIGGTQDSNEQNKVKQEIASQTSPTNEVKADAPFPHKDGPPPELGIVPPDAPKSHAHTWDGAGVCLCGRKKPGRKAPESKPDHIESPLASKLKAEDAKPENGPDLERKEPAIAYATPEQVQRELKDREAQASREKAFAEADKEAKATKPDHIESQAAMQLKAGQEVRFNEGTEPFRLYVNCSSSLPLTDLTSYVHRSVKAVSEAAGVGDIRWVPKDHQLAYGAWKGALADYVRENPPSGACAIHTKGDELAEVIASALSGLAVEVIRS